MEKISQEENHLVYRLFLYILLVASTLLGILIFHFCIRSAIPDVIYIRNGREEEIHFDVPLSAQITKINAEDLTLSQEGEKSKKISDYYKKNTKKDNIGFYEENNNACEVMGRQQYTFNEAALTLKAKKEECMNIPAMKNLCIHGGENSYYAMQLTFLGVIPVKKVLLSPAEEKTVLASGQPIGIFMKTQGVMVINTGEFKNQAGLSVSPAKGILKEGDYILKINGNTVRNKKDVIDIIKNADGKQYVFTILREKEVSDIAITPVLDDSNIYKVGIWIRDSAQGIGTLTYMTPEGKFGALGHGINDSDTGLLMTLKRGSIYATDILSITKGSKEGPGQIMGVLSFDEKDYLGRIEENTKIGIYGFMIPGSDEEKKLENAGISLPVGYKQDVEPGTAQILCSIDGRANYYDIKIKELYYDSMHENQGILFEVVDEKLLKYTGGIVQGMSGCPIIQDGKIVGAVTHVLLKDPTKGYGIFIETMLE